MNSKKNIWLVELQKKIDNSFHELYEKLEKEI